MSTALKKIFEIIAKVIQKTKADVNVQNLVMRRVV